MMCSFCLPERAVRWLAFGLLGVLCISGCVRRRLTVRSDPPGATVYVDHQEIGKAPVSTPFTYYGTRQIRLVKDGFEAETVLEPIRPPWYQIPPLDFISENLVPYEFRDEREVHVQLTPQRVVPTDELRQRAQQLRSATQQGYTIPPPATETTPAVPPLGPNG